MVRQFLGTADQADSQFPVIQPKWRGNINVSYETGPFTLSVQERIIGGYKRSKVLVYQDNDIGAVAYTDLSAVFRVPSGDNEFQFFWHGQQPVQPRGADHSGQQQPRPDRSHDPFRLRHHRNLHHAWRADQILGRIVTRRGRIVPRRGTPVQKPAAFMSIRKTPSPCPATFASICVVDTPNASHRPSGLMVPWLDFSEESIAL